MFADVKKASMRGSALPSSVALAEGEARQDRLLDVVVAVARRRRRTSTGCHAAPRRSVSGSSTASQALSKMSPAMTTAGRRPARLRARPCVPSAQGPRCSRGGDRRAARPSCSSMLLGGLVYGDLIGRDAHDAGVDHAADGGQSRMASRAQAARDAVHLRRAQRCA